MAVVRSLNLLWWIGVLVVALSKHRPATAAVFSASARSESAERTTTVGGAPSELSAFLKAIHAAGAVATPDIASHRVPSQRRERSTVTHSASERKTPGTASRPAGFVVLDQDVQGRAGGFRDGESQNRPTRAPYGLASSQGAPQEPRESGVVPPGITVTSNRTGGSAASLLPQAEAATYSSAQLSFSASRTSLASSVATDWDRHNITPPQQRYYRGIPIASQMRLVEVLGGAAHPRARHHGV